MTRWLCPYCPTRCTASEPAECCAEWPAECLACGEPVERSDANYCDECEECEA